MPITFELEPDDRLVVFHHVDDVPDDELLTFYGDFFDGPQAAEFTKLLILLEQTKSVGRSTGALRALAELLQQKLKGRTERTVVAVVAPGDHSFGMARMYEAMSSNLPWDFHVFRDSESARAWLGAAGAGVP